MDIQVPSVQPIPDVYSPVTNFGDAAINQMQPWMTLHLAWFLDAIGAFVDPVYNIVMEQGTDNGATPTRGTKDQYGNIITGGYVPGYGSLLDLTFCPDGDLPYLSQFVGVSLPTNSDAITQRSLIGMEANLQRGGDPTIILAAQQYLTGTKTVQLIPRLRPDGIKDAYWFLLYVWASEAPADPTELIANVNAAKPAGTLWALITTTGYTWNQATQIWSAETMTWIQADTIHP